MLKKANVLTVSKTLKKNSWVSSNILIVIKII